MRLAREEGNINVLLQREEFDLAERAVESLRAWVLDVSVIEPIKARVAARWKAKTQAIQGRALSRPIQDIGRARRKLKTLVNGESLLFKGGGLLLKYPDGLLLAKDIRLLLGKKGSAKLTRNPLTSSRRAIRIVSRKTPVLLEVKAPFLRVVKVTLGIMVTSKVLEGARVAVLVGARNSKKKFVGRGVSWGHIPVELSAEGRLDALQVIPMAEIPQRMELELRIDLSSRGKATSFRGRLQWEGGRLSLRGDTALPGRARSVAIYVQGADVYVTSLEIQGVVDPRVVR